jgi:hypothetical protein
VLSRTRSGADFPGQRRSEQLAMPIPEKGARKRRPGDERKGGIGA